MSWNAVMGVSASIKSGVVWNFVAILCENMRIA